MLPLIVVTPPAFEAVTLDELKDDRRIEVSDEDADLARRRETVTKAIEDHTSRSFALRTLKLLLDRFPVRCGGVIRPPRPPLVDVVTLKYYDVNNVLQTLDPALYEVDAASEPGRIQPAYLSSWPSTYTRMNAVEITYRAGFATRGEIPPRVRSAIVLGVADSNEQREITITGTIVDQLPALQEMLADEVCYHEYDFS
jgi:uncharacterized phiE125 gp8 family phage protein